MRRLTKDEFNKIPYFSTRGLKFEDSELSEVYSVETEHGTLDYVKYWKHEGAIVMINPKTLVQVKGTKENCYSGVRCKVNTYDEVDSQEYYFVKYNDYECMYGRESDAYEAVVNRLGLVRASKIKRL